MTEQIIPEAGTYIGARSKLESRTRHDALVLFQDAKRRLLNVNGWNNICGRTGAAFELTAATGEHLQTVRPVVGNLIHIKPAADDKQVDDFDWVRIEEFESSKNLLKDEESFSFRIRMVQNPGDRPGESTHFYTSDASSTFFIIRKNSTVYALEYGRSETADDFEPLLSRLRNRLIVISAKLGLVKPQWKNLVNSVLRPI